MDDVIVELDGRRFDGRATAQTWWVLPDGLEDWFDSPETRFDEDLVPGMHGAFEPEPTLMGPRRVTFRARNQASSEAYAVREVRSWAAGLSTSSDLRFRVFQAGRWLYLHRARVRGKARVRRLIDGVTELEIPVWAADPRKYGETQRLELDANVQPSGGLRFPMVDGFVSFGASGGVLFPGVFVIHNQGTADFVPDRFTVVGPVDGFTISSESYVIEYAGAVPVGQQLIITPYAGGRATLDGADVSHNLLQADWVPVQPGETRGFLFTPDEPGAGSRLIVDYPDGAWW